MVLGSSTLVQYKVLKKSFRALGSVLIVSDKLYSGTCGERQGIGI